MKYLCFLTVFLLCFNMAEAQTNANIAGPEHVLVVFNANDQTSIDVKDYYVNARNIPAINIVPGLNLPDSTQITVDNVTHWVGIRQSTDVIRDIYNHNGKTWFPTYHAWQYFYNYVAVPIKDYIENNNLTSTIRYIVLCKGVPFKIQAAGDVSANANVTVESLLCMLNTDNYDYLLQDIFEVFHQQSQQSPNYVHQPILSNPYFSGTYGIDPDYNFNWRFSTDAFTWSWSGHTVKLSYLVSHLDGISYDIVKGIIDRSKDPDMSGNAAWILDNDPTIGFSTSFVNANNRLTTLGFNVVYNNSNDWITSNSGSVIGFASKGTHAEDGNCSWEDSAWVVDSLNFNWANGAIFNSLESFNGQSLTTLNWRYIPKISPDCNHTQGLATQFTEIGGTSFEANGWEPISTPLYWNCTLDFGKTYPAYAMGYSLVDAIYQGIPYLTWVNTVVGDPLTTIAWGKQTLTENTTWQDTILVTDTIFISSQSLTIEENSVINLKHHGFITSVSIFPKPHINDPVTFNITDWSRALFLADDNNHPKLEWGDHPSVPSVYGFNIYKKINDGNWVLLATVYENKYIDSLEVISSPPGQRGDYVYYKITAIINEQQEESDFSNEVGVTVDSKKRKEKTNNNPIQVFSYSLTQNYPNPFNPVTTINYSIQNSGNVQLKVYDILGNEVVTLVDEQKQEGSYSIKFDASKLPSGIYFYRLISDNFISTKKLILLK